MPNAVEEFLEELRASGAVPALLYSMEASIPSCNPSSISLCQALNRAWATLGLSKPSPHPQSEGETPQETDKYSEAYEGGGEGGKRTKNEQCESGFEFWAQTALDYSWEQLHSGHWQGVKLFWRQAYSLAALMNAFNLVLQGKNQEALVYTDKGILLGVPILNHSLHCVAALICKRLILTDGVEVTGCKRTSNFEDDHATRKMGKVRFRSYTPQSLSTDKNRKPFSSAGTCDERTRHMSCDIKDMPLVHMERRLPTLNSPSLEDFHRHHMICSIPVVISGEMDHWPAYAEKKWK